MKTIGSTYSRSRDPHSPPKCIFRVGRNKVVCHRGSFAVVWFMCVCVFVFLSCRYSVTILPWGYKKERDLGVIR